MEVFIGHFSALEYWRLHRVEKLVRISTPSGRVKPSSAEAGKPLRRTVALPQTPQNQNLLVVGNWWGLTTPIDILVGNEDARRVRPGAKQHIFSWEAPEGSFIYTGGSFRISTPEFCFLQLATELPLAKLILLGYELCGRYSLPANAKEAERPHMKPTGFCKSKALTSTKKLKSYLDRMPGVYGLANAQRALQYILEGSRSPMESRLAMLLSLPYKLGGYGLQTPELDSRIDPVKTAKRTASKKFYHCDLYWPDYKLSVEYDSKLHHSEDGELAADSKKRNTLVAMNITTISVRNQQIQNPTELEKVARQLAHIMGKRLQFKNPGFAEVHRELRSHLFSK